VSTESGNHRHFPATATSFEERLFFRRRAKMVVKQKKEIIDDLGLSPQPEPLEVV
jgi:hypothetical protein